MQSLKHALALAAALAGTAVADPTSGIDSALFRSSYDANGIFAVEGARLLPEHDLSLKMLVGYGQSPLAVAVPGIGTAPGDTASDHVLDRMVVLDMAFGLSLSKRFAFGLDIAAYRAQTGAGYGVRGRYMSGNRMTQSTGLIALRALSNIDPSASPDDGSSYLGDGLAGPLDARFGGKLALISRPELAVAVVGSVFLPFGEDEMLLGDKSLVFEPKLAMEFRSSRNLRIVGNLAARIRRRSVLEGFDTQDPAQTFADAKVFLDVGSEAVAGVGAVVDVAPRTQLAAEAQLFLPLPDAASWGDCRRFDGTRCSSIGKADYFAGSGHGDTTVLVTAGIQLRVSADVSLGAMVSTSQLGARGDAFRVTSGITWAPQPIGSAVPSRTDRDGDGIPDSLDACRDEAEDKDGFQDEDGCPEPDNDHDGILDTADKCPDEAEDKDGFEDTDGCPELDNDKDGIPDGIDRCPDQAEDFDNFEDEDGCPDLDNDQDGIPDDKDQCPNDRGTKANDGCPDSRKP